MGVSLPYVVSNKNVPTVFEKIAAAKVPEIFSQTFMAQTLGIKGSNDRPIIPLLRTMGVLDASNKPTPRYHLLRNKAKARFEIAKAVREAYAPLFAADENVNEKSGDDLKGIISQVAGTDEDATKRIAYTFIALVKLGDFSVAVTEEDEGSDEEVKEKPSVLPPPVKVRPEFHYNIQVHLPSNGTEETYLNIFNALRRVFQ